MKYLRCLIYIGLILCLGMMKDSSAQERRIKKADAIYEAGEYHRAISHYRKILDKISGRNKRAPYYYKLGNCYYMSGNIRRSRIYLKRVTKYNPDNKKAWLKLGEANRMMNKYDDALEVYNEYIEVNGKDSVIEKMIEITKLAKEWKKIETRFEVKEMRDFNSRDNDFTPNVVEKDGFDHVYFASTRKGVAGKDKSDITGERFSDIFVSKKNRKKEWSDPVKLDSLNSEYDDGAPHLIENGASMFFTSCQAKKNEKLGCQIYKISKSGQQWLNPRRVTIVTDTLSIGHPTKTPDGDILYFSSRKPGGFGGADIWYVKKDGEKWGEPKNAGQSINTENDELFPYLRNDSTLYFSSNRLPNMGGLDLFAAHSKGKNKWKIENMKPPFSSPGDDFGIYYYRNEEKGFFSSNRDGARDDNIYYFEKPPLKFALEGFVKKKGSKEPIDSAVVHLIGSDGSMFTDTTAPRDGYFSFDLKENTDYVYVVHKDGYFNGKDRLTTDTLYYNHTFTHDIFLETTGKTFEIPNIEFEFGSFNLTDKAKHSLDSLVGVLNDNPNLVIELSAHTDMVGTEEDNMVLSRKRAKAVAEYIESKGIPGGRLKTVGYGESRPVKIDKDNDEYDFLEPGDVLKPEFIEKLTEEQQDIANQLNRRTEFRVIANDFIPTLD